MKQIIIALVTIAISLAGASHLMAADCETLIKDINKQRNFLLRKEMVEAAAKQCPENAILVFKYGFSLERFNKTEEALKYYKKAAELDPKMAQAFFGQGDIHQELKQYNKAIEAYKKGLEIDPTNVRAIKCRLKAEGKLKAGK
ncbi:MAG: tetratricopeptide repeat protein [Thermodesulfobacteriota bacterium]